MARFSSLSLVPALIAAASHAGEITVESRPFSIEKSFSATALPNGDSTLLRLDVKAWKDFEIVKIADHGATIKKGDVLVSFDVEDIDKKLKDARQALETENLNLAQAELNFENLKKTSPHKLDAIRRAAEIAKEENTYFTEIRRKADEETASETLKRYEQQLGNQREELKQLTKMYKADDITENTEEIILIRQQDAVAAAEFAMRMQMLEHKRTLQVSLPREAQALADAARDSAIALTRAEADIPRAIELAKLALEAAKTTNERAEENLAELEADRKQFEFLAPADGWFYYGPIENGRWTPDDIAKQLVPHGKPPVHTAFATFVPASAPLGLISFLDESSARALKPGLTGIATLAGREELEIPVKLVKLATVPGPADTYRADLTVTWPPQITIAAGSTAQVRFIAYENKTAIAIPTKALDYEASGWTVAVKLADGKTERRSVKCGRVSKDLTEILSGVEVGQVIIVP
jgi:HlyD family secretion protein